MNADTRPLWWLPGSAATVLILLLSLGPLAALLWQAGTLSPRTLLADPYLRLPPCGLMPKSALDLSTVLTQQQLSSPFFPPGFELDAVPVPIEQLDLAIREAVNNLVSGIESGAWRPAQ